MTEYQVRIVVEKVDHEEKSTELISTTLVDTFETEDLADDFVAYMKDGVDAY